VFFKAVLPCYNLLPSQVDVNIQQRVTKPFTRTKFTLGLTVCLWNITPKKVYGGLIKTFENMELINQYLFDHNTVSLLFYSRFFLLVENQSIFLSSGTLLGVYGWYIKSP